MTVADNKVGRDEYDRLIAAGVDPYRAAATYEFACDRCGTRTWTGHAGGDLNPCTCPHDDEWRSGEHMQIHAMTAGERKYMGTSATIGQSKPKRAA